MLHRLGSKIRPKKMHIIRENLADLELGWDPFSITENTDTARKSPQNESEIEAPNSLNKSTNEHLRLLLGRWHSPQVAPAAQKSREMLLI